MKRLFVAIPVKPSAEFINAFQSIKEQLKSEKIKWVDTENLHLTLKFIGEVTDEMIGKIDSLLRAIYPPANADFCIEGLGLIKNISDPRAIYANIKNINGIENLYYSIDSNLTKIGIVSETKKFLPHLTLGRIKVLRDKELIQDILISLRNNYFQKVTCSEFILFESILKPKGPIYRKLSGYPI